MKKLRVGIVGCGLISQIAHLPYLQELSHMFEICALCATSEERLNQLSQRFNVPKTFLDYRELVEQDLDAVFVLTRDHTDIALAAAQKGKHVFIEKPLAFNLEQADQIIDCARKKGVKIMVGYMRRYDPGFEQAQEIMKDVKGNRLIRVHSSVGLPFRLVNEMYDIIPAQQRHAEKMAIAKAQEEAALLEGIGKGNENFLRVYSLLLHLWSHNINFMRGTFGDPNHVNYADIRVYTEKDQALPQIQVLAIFDYGSEVSCVWESRAFMNNEAWDEELTLFGNEQTIKISFPFPYLKYAPSLVHVEETVGSSMVKRKIVNSYDEAFKRELRHFHDCIEKEKDPLTNGEDARQDILLAINLIRKARIRHIEGCKD